MKRRIIQLLSFFGINPFVQNYLSGTIYKGNLKSICLPVLNCWSCPGACGSCPIGAIQNYAMYTKYIFSLYTLGIIALFVSILGRFTCGYICPFGFFQDILKSITKKRVRLNRRFKYTKYIILLIFVFILPYFLKEPWFSKICPAGFFEAALPLIAADPTYLSNISNFFYIKVVLSSIFVVAAVFISRPFCQYVCPVGALMELMRPFSLSGLKVDKTCLTCSKCLEVCPMDVDIYNNPHDCIQCGKCINVCPNNSIKIIYPFKKDKADV